MRSTLFAEAEALWDGIWLHPDGTRAHVIVETDDSLEMASLWKSRGNHRSEITVILDDVVGLM